MYRYPLLREIKKKIYSYLFPILFLAYNEMDSKVLNNLLEQDLGQELVLGPVEGQEQGIVVELVVEQEYS
jgi:hypothetical protein